MMRNLKKFIAVACSLTMVASSSVVAFADGPSTANGTGNVLAYSLESVIVPTSIKIALNPSGLPVTTKAKTTAADATYEAATEVTDAETFAENKGYLFKDENGTKVGASDGYDENTTYYKLKTEAVVAADAVTSPNQIVSFNYGLANFSTAAKDVKVSIKATGTASNEAGKTEDIVFVDDIKKAEAYDETSNADGAKMDELKMYLALVAAKELPKVTSTDAFAITTVTGGVDITNVTAKNLADVSMTVAENNAGAVAFAADTTDIAKAEIAFKLGAAEYQIRDYMAVDWDTTQTQLKDMMEIETLGEITGFTFIGAMNPNADWTKAKYDAITFVPTYEVTKITETEVADGGYKQIKTTPASAAPSIATTTYTMAADTPIEVTVNLGIGAEAANAVESVKWDGNELLGTAYASYNAGKITITATAVNALMSQSGNATLVVTFDDEASTAVNLTLTH